MKLIPMHVQPDLHDPFHDKRAWKLNLIVTEERAPMIYIILGDFMDCYSISSHQKNPDVRLLLIDEIASANARLDEIEQRLPTGVEKHFIQGNHEERLDRYIAQRAPDLFGMVTTPEILNLKKRGWKYTPYRRHVKIGQVYYTHDTGKAGASAHIQAERAFSDNAVIGHTHRMAYTIASNSRGAPHVAAMFGWLGNINAAEYMHQINARRDWTLGFGTGWMVPRTGVTYLQPHPIIDYTCCVDGQFFKC
jgi:UDP-2,3-diacylglucosamine pyrophosphatase LpxH